MRVRTPSFFLLLDPWSPLPNCHGEREPWSFFGGGKGCRQAARPSSPCTRGDGANRGRGRGRGRGARGGRGGAPASPPPAAPFLPAVHLGDDPCEFIIRLRRAPRRRLRLPAPFASVLEVEQPEMLNLRMRGCG